MKNNLGILYIFVYLVNSFLWKKHVAVNKCFGRIFFCSSINGGFFGGIESGDHDHILFIGYEEFLLADPAFVETSFEAIEFLKDSVALTFRTSWYFHVSGVLFLSVAVYIGFFSETLYMKNFIFSKIFVDFFHLFSYILKISNV
jgi:hypothetical protein